jgi:hypothetical protein
MGHDHRFTERLGLWLKAVPDERDYAEGCTMFLQLTGRVVMYKNLLAVHDMPRLETELQAKYDFRVRGLTHDQVSEMSAHVEKIAESLELSVERPSPDDSLNSKPSSLDFKRGKRPDHDTLPPEIQALYVENLSVLRRMREVHLRLRSLSLVDHPCPDSERYPFLKELIGLDKKYRGNWKAYDEYEASSKSE